MTGAAREVGRQVTVPEPPDGTRIEFEYGTDVFAAWRDDESSAEAGWTTGDGGEVWCVYPESVPKTWTHLLAEFGEECLREAVWLAPVLGDVSACRACGAAMQSVCGECGHMP